MINYVLKGWGGCISDKFIIVNFGFLKFIELYDKVLVDRGFLIMEEFLLLNVEFLILFGRCGVF